MKTSSFYEKIRAGENVTYPAGESNTALFTDAVQKANTHDSVEAFEISLTETQMKFIQNLVN